MGFPFRFDIGPPNLRSVLARPTPFRYWLAQQRFCMFFDRPHPAEGGGELRHLAGTGVRHLRHLRHPLNVEQKCLRRVSDLSQQ